VEEIQLKVVLDPAIGSVVKSVVAFGDFTTEDETIETAIYNPLELPRFFRDLILGRPLPLEFVSKGIPNLGVFVAMALFLRRELAIHPAMPGLIAAVDLVDNYGVSGLAHVDRDLARFFRVLKSFLSEIPKGASQIKLDTALGWLAEYIDRGSLPALIPDEPQPSIIDRGTNGFVLAEIQRWSWPSLEFGWEELYREGYLRGATFSPMHKDTQRRLVLGARKSLYLSLDLNKAASALNEAEDSIGEPAEWSCEKGLWLKSPPEGTLIPISALTQLLVRL